MLEAFRALDALNEDTFTLDADGIKGLSDFKQNDDLDDDISIIDPEAETEEELQDNYVGKVILDCCVCHSKLYKNKDEVTVDETGELANVGEECPYCFTPDGFKVIGEVAPFDKESEETDDVEEGLVGDVNVNLDASGSSVGFLGGVAGDTKNESLSEGIFDRFKKKPKNKFRDENGNPVLRMADAPSGATSDAYGNMFDGDTPAVHRVSGESSDDMNEGIFGIKTKKEKEFEAEKARKQAEVKAKRAEIDQRAAQEKSDREKEWTEREQRRREQDKKDAMRRRYGSSSSGSSKPSNTGKAGVYYSGGDYYSESLKEDIQDLSMTANDTHLEVSEDESGKVTVSMEPVTANGGETIAPVSPETEEEIMGSGEEIPVEDIPAEEAPAEDEVDVDLDEIDEESVDELGESYFKKVYENVKAYKTTGVKTNGNTLIVEGKIKFNSGRVKKTSFKFESLDMTKNGKVRFVGDNTQLTEGKKAFTLTGRVEGKKLIAESMNYNYKHKGNDGKLTRVYGTERAAKRV